MKLVEKTLQAAREALDFSKRNGLYVHRPVLNGQAWYDWAVKYGVPKPIAANDLHVTVLYSTTDVKMPVDEVPMTIETYTSYEPGCFAQMGPKEETLAYVFDSWRLHERNWSFQRNGAKPTYPTFRPHLSITNEVGDFELPDEALANMPRHIILGGEVNGPIKAADPADDDPDGVDGVDDDSTTLVVVIDIQASAAKAALEADTAKDLNPFDRLALRDIAASKPITKGVAKRLSDKAWAPDAIRALGKAKDDKPAPATAPASKGVEREVVVEVTALPAEILKALNAQPFEATDEEHRVAKGIASVSTVGGVLLEDLQGDTVTTFALWEFNRSLIAGTRAGKFDHVGEVRTEIVGGLVLSEDWQKALGIDLGFEPYLVDIHVPQDDDWEKVKAGDWMLSIAGTMFVEDEAA